MTWAVEYSQGFYLSNTTSATATFGEQPAANNILIFQYQVSFTSSARSIPTGWNRLCHDPDCIGGRYTAVYWKVAGASDTSITVTGQQPASDHTCVYTEISGNDSIDPLDVVSSFYSDVTSPISSGDITPSSSDGMLVGGASVYRNGTTNSHTGDPDFTRILLWEGGGNYGSAMELGYYEQGSTATIDYDYSWVGTNDTVSAWIAHFLAP